MAVPEDPGYMRSTGIHGTPMITLRRVSGSRRPTQACPAGQCTERQDGNNTRLNAIAMLLRPTHRIGQIDVLRHVKAPPTLDVRST
ncbi:uncharacterized protein N7482_009524 [Penicillium canariense]|uniref:Uncharacterized protein n=1 Tax=Penicillium canariense TaxID=189055 RepID=A0A9W9HRF0_9EURO|nr:uncharacterized protein N7482_009524 [Penicillium canariense]KAJ5153046.1 hypothetical protein N7482_009524 [Penicillium canariense]